MLLISVCPGSDTEAQEVPKEEDPFLEWWVKF